MQPVPLKPIRTRLLVSLLPLWFVSCTPVGPNYTCPDVILPATYVEATMTDANQTAPSLAAWWEAFRDPELSSLIAEAQQNNADLHIAVAHLREARALQGVAASGKSLTVNASGSVSRRRESETGSLGPALQRGLMPTDYDLYQAGLDAAWEIDLFGGGRRGVEAATDVTEARLETLRDIRVSLQAEVAIQYLALRLAQQQQIVIERLLENRQENLELLQKKANLSIATQLDVAAAEGQVQAIQSQLPSLRQAQRTCIYRLAVLLAAKPADLLQRLASPSDLPDANVMVSIGIPADLLRRRPDIRQAERELAAATARVGMAQADLYPSLTLTGTFGWTTTDLANLNATDSAFGGIGPGLRVPLFNAGRLRQRVKVADAQTEAALAAYEKTLHTAVGDVETALVAYREDTQRLDTLAALATSQEKTFDMANRLFDKGLLDRPSILAAQIPLLNTANDQLTARTQRTTHLIQLIKALGGSWE
ncbi:MAG: efflux transporter outer membrane subunit [Planctomycetota bacterium]